MAEVKAFKGHGLHIEFANGMAAITEMPGMVGTSPYYIERITGIFRLYDDSGLYDGHGMELISFQSADKEHVTLVLENSVTRLTCSFVYRDGIWSRKDSIKNLQDKEGTIRCYLSRFNLLGDTFKLYAQEGAWCSENQGKWLDFTGGSINITNMGVRTTESAFPFACVRDTEQGNGLAFQLLPMGHWVMKFNKYYSGSLSVISAELGLADDCMALKIQPGEELEMPEILFYSVQPGDKGLGSDKIHRYLLKNRISQKQMPVLYNSWFCDFDVIKVEQFKAQARAAAEIGCEYFVVDAGWFGQGEVWFQGVGDWQENQKTAFCGKMKDFADYVRSLGMKFGVWMEPERAIGGSNAQKEHPEYFLYDDGNSYLFDLAKPEARQFIYNHLKRLVTDYGLEFMKLDFNLAVGHDPSGSSFYRYYQGYYTFMNTIMTDFPQVYFEACASGGLRTDINTACACDCHFLTDTVNPVEILRIMEGGILRLPPKVYSKWYVAQQSEDISRWYHNRNGAVDSHLLACGDGCWGRVIEVGEDFMEALFVTGPMGFSSKLDRLSPDLRQRIRKTVDFFKSKRDFIGQAVCHLLTEPTGISERRSNTMWQFEALDGSKSLLFAFLLEDPKRTLKLHPRNIVPEGRYRVTYTGNYMSPGFDGSYETDGEALIEDGVSMHFEMPYGGRIAEIERLF